MKYLYVLWPWLIACVMLGCSDPESQFVGTWELDLKATDKINLPESRNRIREARHQLRYIRILRTDGTYWNGYPEGPDSLGFNLSGTWKVTPYKPQYSDPDDYRAYLESRSEFRQSFIHPNMVLGYIGIDHLPDRFRPYLNREKLPKYVLECKPEANSGSEIRNYCHPILHLDSDQMLFQHYEKIIIYRKAKEATKLDIGR